MVACPIIVKIIETPPLVEVSKRGHSRAMTAGHKAGGEWWQEKVLPTRFQPFSAGHAPRSAAWVKRKQRRTGKSVALVGLKGLMQSIALQQHVVRAYPTRVTVKVPGPTYATINPKPAKKGTHQRPNLGKEALYVTDRQNEKIGATIGEAYEARLKIEAANFGKRERTFK